MQWSEEQKEILSGTGNMIVSASAGSGKTTVMIEKIRRLIAGGASLKNMVVCTFTNAAAADMRSKLAKKLAEDGRRAELEFLPQADISTIHGLCGRLIRTYFYHTDADPAFEVLRDGEEAAILNECLDTVLARATGDVFRSLNDALLSDRTDKALRRLVVKLYEYARTRSDPDGWLNDCTRLYDEPETVEQRLRERFAAGRERLSEDIRALAAESEAAGFTRNVTGCAVLTDRLYRRAETPAPRTRIPPEFRELNELLRAMSDRVRKFLAREDEALAAPDAGEARAEADCLVSLVRDLSAEYAAAKRRRGRLDFSDLEHYALEILKSPAGDEIRSRVRWVFVDEYQDVNPLQEEIINRLSGGAELFEVGDVKQSIYAFRLCDPRIFAAKYRKYRLDGGGRAVDLNVNYRSASGVVDGVNEVFLRAMTEEFGGVDYAAAALKCGRGVPGEKVRLKIVPGGAPPAYPAVYSVRDDAGGSGKKHGVAAAAVSDIVSLLDQTVRDGGVARPVKPSEIAVIARSRSETLDEIYAMLRARKIPAAYAMKSRVADSPAVRPLVNMLRLIDNRSDDIMLAACLKSRFGGFTDDELADIRRSGGGTFCEAFDRYAGPLRERLDAFRTRLDRYEAMAATAPVDETAGLIVSEAEYFEYLYSEEDGEALAAALSRFLRLAGEVAVTVPELLEYVDSEPDDDAAAADTGDCVRLMTAHASKGLEFPYVLLVDADRKFRFDDAEGPVIADDEYGLAVKRFDYDARKTERTKLYLLSAAAQRRRMTEEELRILYVAMTRAKEKLYIYAAEKKAGDGPTCFLDWLRPALDAEYVEPGGVPDAPAVRRIPARADAALAEAIRARLSFVYPHRHLPQKTTVTALAEREDEASDRRYEGAGTDAERAAEMGTAYHLVMEHIDFGRPFDGEWARLTATYPAETALCDRDKIRTAAAAMAELSAGYRVYREQPFILDDGGTLVQGVIDVLLTDGTSAVVVDYKTTRTKDLATPAYVFQTGMYARAVRELLGLKVKAVYLYSFYTDRLVPVGAAADA